MQTYDISSKLSDLPSASVPSKNFYTEQTFWLVCMQLRNHADTQP